MSNYKIAFKQWTVYYMDNDRQKIIVEKNMTYEKAVQLTQKYASMYNIDAKYESRNK